MSDNFLVGFAAASTFGASQKPGGLTGGNLLDSANDVGGAVVLYFIVFSAILLLVLWGSGDIGTTFKDIPQSSNIEVSQSGHPVPLGSHDDHTIIPPSSQPPPKVVEPMEVQPKLTPDTIDVIARSLINTPTAEWHVLWFMPLQQQNCFMQNAFAADVQGTAQVKLNVPDYNACMTAVYGSPMSEKWYVDSHTRVVKTR